MIVFSVALLLRLAFAVALADTYDGDEFVALALAHRFAQGAVPYRDFMFFHPPGILVLLRMVDPLIHFWWPLGRIGVMVLDALTATLVWSIGRKLYGRKEAIGAGLLYAANPVALLSAGRILPDPLMTTAAMAGLALVVVGRSRNTAFVAGICLAAAVWIKYPALLFVPVYVLAGRQHIRPMLLGFVAGLIALFVGFASSAHQMWVQSVVWQAQGRTPTDFVQRDAVVAVFWLGANAPAVLALLRRRVPHPAWLLLGFGLGALFVVPPQVYYHYLVPIAPFGALLGGPIVTSQLHTARRLAGGLATGVAVLGALALVLHGPGEGLAHGTRFSEAQVTVNLLRKDLPAHSAVLADRFEYGFLAGRPTVPYFWNMDRLVGPSYILRHLRGVGAVVMSRDVGAPTYPSGVRRYLDAQYPHRVTPWTVVWMPKVR